MRQHPAADAIGLSLEGPLERADERQLVIKTTARLRDARSAAAKLHPYDVPEFVVIPIIQGSHDYLSWLVREHRARSLKLASPRPKPRPSPKLPEPQVPIASTRKPVKPFFLLHV